MSSKGREATDPDGRPVILDERTISHLQSRRSQMVGHAAVILDAVSRPDLREDDPVPGRERFYRRDLDPERWLRVVAGFTESPAFVGTAFVQHNPPGTRRRSSPRSSRHNHRGRLRAWSAREMQ
jgi:hypothetical protein